MSDYPYLARGTRKSREREIASLLGAQLTCGMKMIEFPRAFPLRTLMVCITIWLIATEAFVFDQIKFQERTDLLQQAARAFHGQEVIVPNQRPSTCQAPQRCKGCERGHPPVGQSWRAMFFP